MYSTNFPHSLQGLPKQEIRCIMRFVIQLEGIEGVEGGVRRLEGKKATALFSLSPALLTI